MKPIYVVAGVPGSGKTWVCKRLIGKFEWLPHDDYIKAGRDFYVKDLLLKARTANKPVLAEAPFLISPLIEALKAAGADVRPYFVIESAPLVKMRYEAREGKPIPKQHLTRIKTVKERAAQYNAPSGTSDEIFKMLYAKGV